MRKIASLLVALLLVSSLACPAFAKGKNFVPSITYKGKPGIVPIKVEDKDKDDKKDKNDKDDKKDKNDKDGKENGKDKIVIGIVRKEEKPVNPENKPGKDDAPHKEDEPEKDAQHGGEDHADEVISYVYEECLVVTPVAEVDTSEDIPEEEAETLRYVYEELSEGRMKLPYEKAEDYDGEDMVILELMDATWLCKKSIQVAKNVKYDHDHHEEVEPEDVVFDITFDLGVKADAKVIVMTYNDNEWEPIAKVVNNGDGTVTCTFEHFCPIAISVVQNTGTPEETNNNAFLFWVVVMMAALGCIMTVVLKKMKKKEAK